MSFFHLKIISLTVLRPDNQFKKAVLQLTNHLHANTSKRWFNICCFRVDWKSMKIALKNTLNFQPDCIVAMFGFFLLNSKILIFFCYDENDIAVINCDNCRSRFREYLVRHSFGLILFTCVSLVCFCFLCIKIHSL